ncbi:MAG: TldD/PmbA family protein [bacterium]|nr:TldD/PmbA family protein [bacterium]
MDPSVIKNIRGTFKEWDLFHESVNTLPVIFENNELKSTEENFREGAGLRIIQDGKLGFSSTTQLSGGSRLTDYCQETSRLGDTACFSFPDKKAGGQDLKVFDDKVRDLTLAMAADWGLFFIEKFSRQDEKLKVNVTIEKNIIRKHLINSAGLDLEEEKSVLDIMVSLFRAEENNFLEVYDYRSMTRLPDQKEIEDLSENLDFLYRHSLDKSEIKSGYYKVFFSPKAFSHLLGLLLASFDGKLFEKKISYFCDKIGSPFSAMKIDLIDDPSLEGRVYSTGFDGEGIRPERLYLIKDGRVNDFSLDLQTAGKLKKSTNGHGMRGYSSMPNPGFTNIEFKVHDDNLIEERKKMINSIDEGIWVDQLLGAGQSNILGGELSANIDLGYYISQGEIKGRIKDTMITGNFFDFFNKILNVEKERYSYSRFLVPGILFDGISVAVK